MATESRQRADLLGAIRRQPKDETLRLAFADLVQEEGDEKWAEFIRVQIRRRYIRKNSKEGVTLRKREWELFSNLVWTSCSAAKAVTKGSIVRYGYDIGCHEPIVTYYSPTHGEVRFWYGGGMPSSASCGLESFAKLAPHLFAWPLDYIDLTDARPRRPRHEPAEWQWWYHDGFFDHMPCDLPRALITELSVLYPRRADATANSTVISFGSEAAAYKALNAAVLAFGRRAYERHAAARLRRLAKRKELG